MRIISGLLAWGIVSLLLAGPSPADTVEIVADGFGASDALAVWEIVYEDVPTLPARWDVTADLRVLMNAGTAHTTDL